MTPKQRILNALYGKENVRPTWSPFLAYWWETQSGERIALGQLKYLESIGADPLLRGFGSPFKISFKNTCVKEQKTATERVETWETPVGKLRIRYVLSQKGNTWFLVDHPVSSVEGLKTLSWVYEHAEINYDDAVDKSIAEIGDRALFVPLVGSEMKTCFQSLVEKYVGIQNLTYLIADEEEEVSACLSAMREISDKTACFAADSNGEAFIFWEDSSTTSINPDMFTKFTAPEITAWAKPIHEANKLLIHHACGHIKALLPLMAKTGVDSIESISPPTTGNIDIPEAFSLLPDNISLIGGIEPVFFADCTKKQLEERVDYLFNATSKRKFLLANSDSCPPEVEEWKLSFVSELVKKYKG